MGIASITGFLDVAPSRFEPGVRFWTAVTGAAVSEPRGSLGEFATLVPTSEDPYLRVQRLGQGPSAVHLDLHADNVDGTARRAQALAAEVVRTTDHWTTLLDPTGVTSCITARDPDTGVLWPLRPRLLRAVAVDDPSPSTPGSACAACLAGGRARLG